MALTEQTQQVAHTEGPWEAVEATEHHGWYVTSAFGNTICDLYCMSQPAFASTANGGPSKPVPFMHEMDGPNARLIAAAPELLEACRWAEMALSDYRAGIAKGYPQAALEKLRAAISSARGESGQ